MADLVSIERTKLEALCAQLHDLHLRLESNDLGVEASDLLSLEGDLRSHLDHHVPKEQGTVADSDLFDIPF